ncbi:hypothetical protein FRC06_006805 [Ceratobasidium sp. 370]|nr:hypothetical protein FRC06_006805 [Ceratobasidium sp. 370]
MADVDDSRRANGRQLASNLRELLNKVDIKAGAERSERFDPDEAEVSTILESERSQSPQASLRDVFAKARTAIPRVSVSTRASATPSSSRLPHPRRSSIDSDISSTPTAMFTPGRPREDQLGVEDDESTLGTCFLSSVGACLHLAERTPVAHAPPQLLGQTPSAAASFHALRARLENASDNHTDAGTDLTGWDRSARSLLTTRGQASSSKLNMYLDDNDDTNLLDEDLGGVPALTVSHVDDSNMRFAPSVSSTRTPVAPRSRPGAIPKGPSLQSSSLAERLADIPDDGLEFDDTDREDFDRNRMDDNEDLLNNDNDLLRSSSPPPDSPRRPPAYRSLAENAARLARPISGSWENVMGESLLSFPHPPESPERPMPTRTFKPMTSANLSGSSSGDASRLMQTIQSEEESFQRTQEKSRQTATENSQWDASNANQPDATTATVPARTSRLSTFGRSRLPLAKPSPKPPADASSSSTKSATSEISFPRASTPTLPQKHDPAVGTAQSSKFHPPVSPPRAVSPKPGASDSLARPPSSLGAPSSPVRSISRGGAPVTPSRIPRVSMHGSRPSWDRMDDVTNKSPSQLAPQTPARSRSSLGHSSRLTPARSASSLGHRATPPETDVDRERAWGKPLPKLTHANLRMRHDSMESSVGSSVYGALSPGRPGSVVGMSPTGRPTTPSGRSFVGYSVRVGSEVSSSQGSAGSDEDAQARRDRKMSLPTLSGTRSGAELRGGRSSLTSPTASSLARSAGLTRHSSLKSPSRTSTAGAPPMRHSASFAGSSVSGVSDRASSVGSPGSRRVVSRQSVGYDKEAEHLRERDWGRPVHSRAPGIGSISPRPPRVSGVRPRVVSSGSAGAMERPESPIPRMRASSGMKPRPHTIHFGSAEERMREMERRGPLTGGEELLEREEEIEQDPAEDREQYSEQTHDSPPSPSRSIPLPPSPPAARATAPTEASVSLFKMGPEGEEPAAESTRRVIPTESEPESPVKRVVRSQQESPTISFMDTLPPLPEPPSEDEIEAPVVAAPVPVVRPSLNTRLSAHHRVAREPSPASGGSGSERTPRVSSLILPTSSAAQSRTPSPPIQSTTRTESQSRGLDLVGVEQNATAPMIARSRSSTLGALPRVDINLTVPRDEIDSAATPVATRWMERNRLRETVGDRGPGSTSRDGNLAPKSDAPLGDPTPLLDQRPPNPPAPMISQRGRDVIQRMQHSTAALARDLEVESSHPVPQADAAQAETEHIVKLSTAARTERERLERLRSTRQGELEKAVVSIVPAKRWSVSWVLLSVFLTALCAWLALYALSQRAANVYLDPLYPILYGDVNPLRPARTIDTFPASWHVHVVPKLGIQQYLPTNTLSQNWQKLWGIPSRTVQHLLLNWPPS